MRAIATLLAERGDPLHDRCRYSESAAHCFSSIGMVGGEQFVRVDDLCTAISRCYPQLAGGGFFEYGSIMEYGRFQPGQDRRYRSSSRPSLPACRSREAAMVSPRATSIA